MRVVQRRLMIDGAVAAVLLLVIAYLARASIQPDSVAYLENAELFAHGNWAAAFQGYWSPGSSLPLVPAVWLVGAAIVALARARNRDWRVFPLASFAAGAAIVAAFVAANLALCVSTFAARSHRNTIIEDRFHRCFDAQLAIRQTPRVIIVGPAGRWMGVLWRHRISVDRQIDGEGNAARIRMEFTSW